MLISHILGYIKRSKKAAIQGTKIGAGMYWSMDPSLFLLGWGFKGAVYKKNKMSTVDSTYSCKYSPQYRVSFLFQFLIFLSNVIHENFIFSWKVPFSFEIFTGTSLIPALSAKFREIFVRIPTLLAKNVWGSKLNCYVLADPAVQR